MAGVQAQSVSGLRCEDLYTRSRGYPYCTSRERGLVSSEILCTPESSARPSLVSSTHVGYGKLLVGTYLPYPLASAGPPRQGVHE